jgi:hypothetical protein
MMDQQHIVSRSRNAIPFSVRQPLHTDNIVFLSERKRLQPLGYHLLYLLCVFLPLPFLRIFDFLSFMDERIRRAALLGDRRHILFSRVRIASLYPWRRISFSLL